MTFAGCGTIFSLQSILNALGIVWSYKIQYVANVLSFTLLLMITSILGLVNHHVQTSLSLDCVVISL